MRTRRIWRPDSGHVHSVHICFACTCLCSHSLARLQVVLLGSDGRRYPFLCKPKDDLRKDARMMELGGVLNRLLARRPATRKRQLKLRSFAVLPLSDDCGMVEWVEHTRGFRQIMQVGGRCLAALLTWATPTTCLSANACGARPSASLQPVGMH